MSKQRLYFLIGGIVCGIFAAIVLSFSNHNKLSQLPPGNTDVVRPTGAIRSTPLNLTVDASYPQISLADNTKTAAVKLWLERLAHDKLADWKTHIAFYGRVVDQASNGVPDANVRFQWTNLSAKGTADAETRSDDRGFFELSGVEGKSLTVKVQKVGYYGSERQSFKSFEFSNPGEERYYEPHPDHPVLFQLKKKGEGANLIAHSVKVMLQGSGAISVLNLMTGKESPSGQLHVQSWKPWPPRPMLPHYDWKVVLSIPDGGFVYAPEEFAFEAPETAYEQPLVVDMRADAGPAWQVGAEKTAYFAFGEPRKYGRLHFRTDAATRYVFIDYVLNPSGSRNLENASAATSTN